MLKTWAEPAQETHWKLYAYSVYNCVLGGTHQENDFNTAMDDNDTAFVLNGCKDMVPGLKVGIALLLFVL